MFGTVCLEMIGRRRDWTQQEIDFAASVADIVALLMEQADRLRAPSTTGRI
jgi:GAF domain-containing protein